MSEKFDQKIVKHLWRHLFVFQRVVRLFLYEVNDDLT